MDGLASRLAGLAEGAKGGNNAQTPAVATWLAQPRSQVALTNCCLMALEAWAVNVSEGPALNSNQMRAIKTLLDTTGQLNEKQLARSLQQTGILRDVSLDKLRTRLVGEQFYPEVEAALSFIVKIKLQEHVVDKETTSKAKAPRM
jgi:hypothetical protein